MRREGALHSDWQPYPGPQIAVFGVDRLGAAAPGEAAGEVVIQERGFTVENVYERARLLPQRRKEDR